MFVMRPVGAFVYSHFSVDMIYGQQSYNSFSSGEIG